MSYDRSLNGNNLNANLLNENTRNGNTANAHSLNENTLASMQTAARKCKDTMACLLSDPSSTGIVTRNYSTSNLTYSVFLGSDRLEHCIGHGSRVVLTKREVCSVKK